MTPHRLGPYEIVIPIASGARAAVYLGRKQGADEYVAIRVPHEPTSHNVDKTLTRLRHENIVDLLDSGRHEDTTYFVQEYVPGTSLSNLRVDVPNLPRGVAMRIALDAVFGLHAMHEHARLVHRDFCPRNIMVGTDGVGRLVVGAEPTAPEDPAVIRDRSTDIRAAAIVVWEILAERPVDTAVPPRLRDVARGVNVELDDIVAKALLLDNAARTTSDARRFGEALAAAAEASGLLSEHLDVARTVDRITARELRGRKERLDDARREQSTRPPSMPDVRTLIGAPGPPTMKRPPLPSLPDAPSGDGRSDLRIAVSLAKSGERADAELLGSRAPPPPDDEPEVFRSPVVAEPTGLRRIINQMTTTQWSLLAACIGFFVGFLVLLSALRHPKPMPPKPVVVEPTSSVPGPAPTPVETAAPPPIDLPADEPSIEVTANARIVSVRIGDRVVDSVVPAPSIAIDLIGNEGTAPIQVTATSVDGRSASATVPPGARSASLTFASVPKKPLPAGTSKHPWSKRK